MHTYHILLIHPSVGGYMGCFYLLAIVNRAAMIGCTDISMIQIEIIGSYGNIAAI